MQSEQQQPKGRRDPHLHILDNIDAPSVRQIDLLAGERLDVDAEMSRCTATRRSHPTRSLRGNFPLLFENRRETLHRHLGRHHPLQPLRAEVRPCSELLRLTEQPDRLKVSLVVMVREAVQHRLHL